ncbi:WD repeat-containing protein 74 [Heracleum sosnowskyi]|uniref:WD repeat-containing protein 74 n=1 Tax=Heracleum sosnowskyi TaxID=360622 RepID=A0AAD8GXK4_9APIA|nr:WD repeat-containing protein 74 [Heracleum sosnowskyi]
MPRTSVIECPGCPPVRALTFDVLGLIKVVEARGKEKGVAKVVERWGEPDPSKCVLAASIDDCEFDPLLAVARKCGSIELISPVNGDLRLSLSNGSQVDGEPEDDPVSGLHLFKKKKLQSSSRSCTLLSCSKKGRVVLRSVELSSGDVNGNGTPLTWTVCGSGDVLCSKVDENENYALFGGKRVEVNVWDLEKRTKIWTAKSPPKNNLDIFTPTWFTSATFLNKDDHRKLVTGTNQHQVRLYDIAAQRRPVISFDFLEASITAVTEDLDGRKVYVGNGSGDLASFDIRTGKLLGRFSGKCSGSIKSIARHPELPVLASCGLDRYLRFWDTESRQLLSAVFLKQHLTSVVLDSQFNDEEVAGSDAPIPPNVSLELELDESLDEGEEDPQPVKKKKKSKELSGSKKKKNITLDEDEEDPQPVKRKKKSKELGGSKKKKTKQQSIVLYTFDGVCLK